MSSENLHKKDHSNKSKKGEGKGSIKEIQKRESFNDPQVCSLLYLENT